MSVFRPGAAGDLAAVEEIQGSSPEAAQWKPGDYLNQDFHVAVEQERVVGFLVCRQLAAGEYEILNLAVAPEFRRRGVARGLLKAWLGGVSGDVFLEVRESNEAARRFYETIGFQQVNMRRKYYESPREAAIVMKFHSC